MTLDVVASGDLAVCAGVWTCRGESLLDDPGMDMLDGHAGDDPAMDDELEESNLGFALAGRWEK